MKTTVPAQDDLRSQVENMKLGIKELTHAINNPLGVIRMALYLMETAPMDDQKRDHYLAVIGESIDKIESGLKSLKELREDPAGWVYEDHSPEETSSG